MENKALKTLLELLIGEVAVVESIEGGHRCVHRIERMGIRPGVQIRKISDVGPIVVEVGNSRVAIGRGMASKVIVKNV